MSLTTERLLIESKISEFIRERFNEKAVVDMYINTIREEASTLLELQELDVVKIRIAAESLENSVCRIRKLDEEIRRLEKML